MFSPAKVQRKSETAKSLAEFLVFCSYVKISKSAFFIHRLSQIFIFGTEIHGFFKGTALAPH